MCRVGKPLTMSATGSALSLSLSLSLTLFRGVSCVLFEDSLAPVAVFLAPVLLSWTKLSHQASNLDT